MRLSRSDNSLLSEWWFSVDRLLLGAVLLLMGMGLILSLAASPPVAIRHGLEPFYFFKRHALWFVPAVMLLLSMSMMTPQQMRRVSLIVFVCGTALMIGILLFGPEINGARRWLRIGALSLQPSEFVKPAFVVLAAWLLAESATRPGVPGRLISFGLLVLFCMVLVLQPDFGQVMLVVMIWGTLFFLSGASLAWIGALIVVAGAGTYAGYYFLSHVRERIDQFFDPSSGDSYQTGRALQSFAEGGWFGRGPGEGVVKNVFPDSYTDFIFSVVGEEFGVLGCLVLLVIFGFLVLRTLSSAMTLPDRFACYGSVGLMVMVGLQAIISMAVNTVLIPATGMTLPFLSYGGSSLLGLSMAVGMVLGLSRQRSSLASEYSANIVESSGQAPGEVGY